TLADGGTYQFAWVPTPNTVNGPFFISGSSSGGGGGGGAVLFRYCTTCYEGYNPLIDHVDVTDPRGSVRRVTFGPTGYITSDIYALGQPEEQTISYTYYADNLIASKLLTSPSDPLGRKTTYDYDANGNPSRLTSLDELLGQLRPRCRMRVSLVT